MGTFQILSPLTFLGFDQWQVCLGRAVASLKRLNCPPTLLTLLLVHFQFKSDWVKSVRNPFLKSEKIQQVCSRRREIGCSVLREEVTCQSLIGGGITRYWAACAVCSYIVQLYYAAILCSYIGQLYCAAILCRYIVKLYLCSYIVQLYFDALLCSFIVQPYCAPSTDFETCVQLYCAAIYIYEQHMGQFPQDGENVCLTVFFF